jgi:hypothetical protein
MGVPGDCRPFHSETVIDGEDEFRIFRCDWGWCVKRGDEAYRSRTLVEALEQACHGRLEQTLLRDVVGAIQRALEAEHTSTGRTASAVVARDALQLTSPEARPPG